MIRARRTDPETSHDAAASIGEAARCSAMDWVFRVVRARPGITRKGIERITEKIWPGRWSPEAIRGAVVRLIREFSIYESPLQRKQNPSGCKARVLKPRWDRRRIKP